MRHKRINPTKILIDSNKINLYEEKISKLYLYWINYNRIFDFLLYRFVANETDADIHYYHHLCLENTSGAFNFVFCIEKDF